MGNTHSFDITSSSLNRIMKQKPHHKDETVRTRVTGTNLYIVTHVAANMPFRLNMGAN